ncbi:MAG: S8 family serine peptidase [Candidatus Falkowbacteria bacterium]
MNKNIAFFFTVCLAILLFCSNGGEVISVENENNTIRKADEILVKFKNSNKINIIKIADQNDFYDILENFNNNNSVEYAEPNYLYNASIIPSDTYYSNQWYLQKIKAEQAWNKVRSVNNIVIAIIDSGVQINHIDLKDNIWKNINEIPGNEIDDDKNGYIDDVNGWDFVSNVADPGPKFSQGFTEAGVLHGTIVAGIAAASGNNATGISGVAWDAKIMPLKVLDDKGEGNTGDVIKSINYAIDNGADVINFSFVGFGFSKSLDSAIRLAYEAGIIIVAAAGNEEGEGHGHYLDETPMYPACHDGNNGENMVIGVAAVDTMDQKANFSSYGSKCVDISAPGISIFSTSVYSPKNEIEGRFFDKYYDGYWAGTSMATPMVSAAAALIGKANPEFNRNQVISALLGNADNINRLNMDYLNQLGSGRLNLEASINYALSQSGKTYTKLLIAPYSDLESKVKITDLNGYSDNEFYSYGENFRGGVNIASGDVDGDGIDEIIVGAGKSGGPHVRIFDIDGNLKGQFFAYDKNFRGGVNVASGDVDGDGIDEIIAGAGTGGGPHVRIFKANGKVQGQFFAYDKNFRGGVNVAVGDVDGDGIDEIIAGAGTGGGPHVRIFKANGKVQGQFFAYDKNFRGGVNVAVGNSSGRTLNNKLEIITSPGAGGGPHIRIFDNHGNVQGQFFAYDNNFRGGVNISAGDVDKDGFSEIITGAGPGGAPHVKIFEINGKLVDSFYAYNAEFSGGVSVSAIKINK